MLATVAMNRSAAKARLKHLLKKPGPRSLDWHHTVGGLVPGCLPSRPKYGDYFALLDEVVDSFKSGASSRESKITTLRGVLDTSKAFHQAYSAAEVRMLETPQARSHRLTWNHLRILVRVPAAERERMQRAAIKGRWSSARLTQELLQKYGRKNPGGRRVQKSPDARQALYGLIRQSKRWLLRAMADWPIDEEEFLAMLDKSGDLQPVLTEAMTIHAEFQAHAETVQAALSRLQNRVRKSNRRKSR